MKSDLKVLIFHRKRRRMCATNFPRLPNESELVWINDKCFEVEKVVHTVDAHPNNEESYWRGPAVFVKDVPAKIAKEFSTDESKGWNREDNLATWLD
jgi:hypothetical protein